MCRIICRLYFVADKMYQFANSCIQSYDAVFNNIMNVSTILFISIIIDGILCILATLGNGLIIFSILRSSTLQTPSYLLITSLAFLDLLVGLVYFWPYMVLRVFYLQENAATICYIFGTNFVLPSLLFFAWVSLAMSALISCDRYLALHSKYRYRVIVTRRRVVIAVFIAWLSGLVFAILRGGVIDYSINEMTGTNIIINVSLGFSLLLTSCIFYTLSFITLRHYTSQVNAQQPNPLQGSFNVVKYKKTVNTMVIVLGCLVLCYVPLFIGSLLIRTGKFRVYSDSTYEMILQVFAYSIFGLNSVINPLIYVKRFADVRQACRKAMNDLKVCGH